MDSRTRFLILLCALLAFFVTLFFLSGVLHVRKNQRVVIAKRGRYFTALTAGWYYFPPWLYQIQNPLPTEKATFHFRTPLLSIEWEGVVRDPRAYFEQGNSYRKSIKNELHKSVSKEELSRQILSQLKKNGWDVEKVNVIER